jgi:hypothetical protein
MARSAAFAMTEPAVASSDATNIELRMDRNGDGYLLNGRRWFASNAVHANCRVLIVMGRTDPSAAPHRQQSMVVVPIDASGVQIVRSLPMFGYQDREGHAEIELRMSKYRHAIYSKVKGRASPSVRHGLRSDLRSVSARTSATGSPKHASRLRNRGY